METSKRVFGIIGLVIGLLALGASTIPYFLPRKNPPPMEKVVAEGAVRIKEAVAARLKGEPKKAEPAQATGGYNTASVIRFVAVSLAFVALSFGVIGYARREDKRVCIPATALGVGSIALQFFLVALILILLVMLIAVVLCKLDF